MSKREEGIREGQSRSGRSDNLNDHNDFLFLLPESYLLSNSSHQFLKM